MRTLFRSGRVNRWGYLGLLGAALLGTGPTLGAVQEGKRMETPLEVLGRLVGGYWRMEGDKSTTAYNVFTWGPGHRTLHGTFYRLGDGKNEDPVRAEAFYFWHTAKKKICGIAAGEEGEVYEGEYTIEGNTWTQDFQYHSAQGTSAFRETWEFPNNDTYVWTLYKKVNGSLEERMRATFRRGKEKPIAP